MRIVKGQNNTLIGTLSREDSRIWAGSQTPDGRDLDEVRDRNRKQMAAAMARRGSEIGMLFASARHGGCTLDVIEVE